MLVVLQALPNHNAHNQAKCYQSDVCKCPHRLKISRQSFRKSLSEIPRKV